MRQKAAALPTRARAVMVVFILMKSLLALVMASDVLRCRRREFEVEVAEVYAQAILRALHEDFGIFVIVSVI